MDTHRVPTVQAALQEAVRMLREEFGDIDQRAAVDLAAFLFTAQERQDFLERHGDDPNESIAYGAR